MEFTHVKKLKGGELAEITAEASFIDNCDCCSHKLAAHLESIEIKGIQVFKNELDLKEGEGREPSQSERDEINTEELECSAQIFYESERA